MIVPKITAGGDKRKAWNNYAGFGMELLNALDWMRENGSSQDQLHRTYPNGDKVSVRYYGNLPHIHLYAKPVPPPAPIRPEWEFEFGAPVLFVYFSTYGFLPGPGYVLPTVIGFVWDIEKNEYYKKVPRDGTTDDFISFPEDTSEFGDWIDDQVLIVPERLYDLTAFRPSSCPSPDHGFIYGDGGSGGQSFGVPAEFGGGTISASKTLSLEDPFPGYIPPGITTERTWNYSWDYDAWSNYCSNGFNDWLPRPFYHMDPTEGVVGSEKIIGSRLTTTLTDHYEVTKESEFPYNREADAYQALNMNYTWNTPLGSFSEVYGRTTSVFQNIQETVRMNVTERIPYHSIPNYAIWSVYGDGFCIRIYAQESIVKTQSYVNQFSWFDVFYSTQMPFSPSLSWIAPEVSFGRTLHAFAQCDNEIVVGPDGVSVDSLGRNSDLEDAIQEAYSLFISTNELDTVKEGFTEGATFGKDWSMNFLLFQG